MSMSVNTAAEILRETMRETVKQHSLWYLVKGVLLVAAGAVAVIFPVLSSALFVVMLGWLLIIAGIIQAISLIGASKVPHFWLELISAVLGLVTGFLLLRAPGIGMLSITLLLIVFLMISGIAKIVFALTIRPFPNWGWLLASGTLGVALSILLWGNMPVTTLWLIGLLVGVQLISEGLALSMLAWKVRGSPD